MPAKQQDEQPANHEQQAPQQLGTVISGHVLHALGRPGDLCRVQVRRLWQDHYRVNVLVGADITTARIAHSYFLVADDNGSIVESTPEITRLY
jgi:hypothetical protein